METLAQFCIQITQNMPSLLNTTYLFIQAGKFFMQLAYQILSLFPLIFWSVQLQIRRDKFNLEFTSPNTLEDYPKVVVQTSTIIGLFLEQEKQLQKLTGY